MSAGNLNFDVLVVDYNMSNLCSVESACRYVGLRPIVSSDPTLVAKAPALILPGVGAFGEAMSRLRELGLEKEIKDFVQTGKPVLGICLGLQLLFSESVEFGRHKGLDIIAGRVLKFPKESDREVRLPVPHIGWNAVEENADHVWKDTLLATTKSGEFMYFVHSFFVEPNDEKVRLATTQYGETRYCSAIKESNITALQFHPEKSGKAGLAIYKAFAESLKGQQ